MRTVNDLDNYYNILNNDKDLNLLLTNNLLYIYDEVSRKQKYTGLIEILLQEDFENLNESYIKNYIREVMFPIMENVDEVYTLLIYTFQYSSVKSFFYTNWNKFIPEFDKQLIENSTKLEMFHKSFMKEFDYFSQLISEISIINNIDKIPDQYLDYVSELLGYNRTAEEKTILDDKSFRALLKNIVDIYNRKGTNFSVELFFNFLGIDVDIEEFWFDRRFNDTLITKNPFTGSTDKNDYKFYLTTKSPRDGYYIGDYWMNKVAEKEWTTDCPNLIMFNYLASGNSNFVHTSVTKKAVSQLLLWENGAAVAPVEGNTGPFYKYFKTNYINLKMRAFKSNISTNDNVMTTEDRALVDYFVKFIAPIFILKNYETVVEEGTPEVLFAFTTLLDDADVADGWTDLSTITFTESWFENMKPVLDRNLDIHGYISDSEIFEMLNNDEQVLTFESLNSFDFKMNTFFTPLYYKDTIGENIKITQVI